MRSAAWRSRRWWSDRWWVQAGVVYGLYSLYGWIRSRVDGPRDEALANALDVVELERSTGTFFEESVQDWFLRWPDVVRFWNVFYGAVHFTVPVLAFVILWRGDRERYRFWRDVFLVMLAAGIAGFVLYPLMPPRLLPPPFEFVDTAVVLGPWSEDPEDAANLYAAMPSLHIGMASWAATATFPLLRSWWARLAVVTYPFVMLLATVVTGNHYWIDGLGGVGALGLAWAVVRARRRFPARARPRSGSRQAGTGGGGSPQGSTTRARPSSP